MSATRPIIRIPGLRSALAPTGGTLVGGQPDGDGRAVALVVQLLLSYPGSRVYSASEYAAMLRAADFHASRSDGEELVWAMR